MYLGQDVVHYKLSSSSPWLIIFSQSGLYVTPVRSGDWREVYPGTPVSTSDISCSHHTSGAGVSVIGEVTLIR